MKKWLVIFIVLFSLTACLQEDLELVHTNPLDRIYDDGDFRIVLTMTPESGGDVKVRWSDLTYQGDEVEEDDFSASSFSLLSVSGAASDADIDTIKVNQSLSWTQASDLDESEAAVEGEETISEPGTDTSYVIEIQFSYKDPDGENLSGIIHSNVVYYVPGE